MKYKVGDEVLVKVRIHHIVNQETDLPYEVKEINNGKIGPRTIWIGEEDIQPYPQMTAEEAWEITKRLFLNKCDGIENAFSDKELEDIFGTRDLAEIVNNNTPNQIKAKIEVWETAKEIKVGDEVAPKSDPNNNECKFVVTIKDDEDGIISGFSVFDGDVFSGRDIKLYQKTGRHIDIEGLLKQIGGEK